MKTSKKNENVTISTTLASDDISEKLHEMFNSVTNALQLAYCEARIDAFQEICEELLNSDEKSKKPLIQSEIEKVKNKCGIEYLRVTGPGLRRDIPIYGDYFRRFGIPVKSLHFDYADHRIVSRLEELIRHKEEIYEIPMARETPDGKLVIEKHSSVAASTPTYHIKFERQQLIAAICEQTFKSQKQTMKDYRAFLKSLWHIEPIEGTVPLSAALQTCMTSKKELVKVLGCDPNATRVKLLDIKLIALMSTVHKDIVMDF